MNINYIASTASLMAYGLLLAHFLSQMLFNSMFNPIVYVVIVLICLFVNSKMNKEGF